MFRFNHDTSHIHKTLQDRRRLTRCRSLIYRRLVFLYTFANPDAYTYVAAYFQNLQPVYPFLDQHDFKSKALGPNVRELLSASPAFSALYYTVLALGCQYHEGGTWEPGKGKAWKLFQVALGLIADVLLPRTQLTGLQVSFIGERRGQTDSDNQGRLLWLW